MLRPGRYRATAIDGSGETIIVRAVGSDVRVGTFNAPNAKAPGLCTLYSEGGEGDDQRLDAGHREVGPRARVQARAKALAHAQRGGVIGQNGHAVTIMRV